MKKLTKLISASLLICILAGFAIQPLATTTRYGHPMRVHDAERVLPDFINDIQLKFMKYVIENKQKCIPFAELELSDVLPLLETYREIQLENGGIPSEPDVISAEQNAHIFSGLVMLQKVYRMTMEFDDSLFNDEPAELVRAMNLVNHILYGDKLFYDQGKDGIIQLFSNRAFWNPKKERNYSHLVNGQGEDVGTELDILIANMTVLNAVDMYTQDIDVTWQLWQTIKRDGGFDNPVRIFNSFGEDPAYDHFNARLSDGYGEAINLLRSLIAYYEDVMTVQGVLTEEMTVKIREYTHFLKIDCDALEEDLFQYDPSDYYELPWLALLDKKYNPYTLGGQYGIVW